MSIRESACGKVILLGEHAVVYGHPALAAGLANGAIAEFDAVGDGAIRMDLANIGDGLRPGETNDLTRALAALLAALSSMENAATLTDGVIRARLELPAGGGVGSSAALGVAIARALGRHALGRAITLDEAVALGFAWERVFHGNPSGLDHTVAAYGGAGLFTRSAGFSPIRLRAPLTVLFADTGERTPTKETVGRVATLRERRPEVVDKACEGIASLARNGALALEANDLSGLGQLMDLNQHLLSALMVSTERTEVLCRAAREAGALGAKLTGGGGGGCVIALGRADAHEAILSAWKREGASTFAAVVE